MLRCDLQIRMQAVLHIAGPDLDGFIDEGQQIRRSGLLRHTGRQLLPVLGAAVAENLPHNPGRPAPDVAVVVHQQLIQKRQQLALLLPGQIGVVLGIQVQIGADALQVLFVSRLLQKLFKGGVVGDLPHQADIIVEGQVCQLPRDVPAGQKRRPGHLRHTGAVRHGVGIRAVTQQVLLKIMQLGIYRAVTELFFRRHIRQLAEDLLIGLRQRIDPHLLLAAIIPVAPDAEIRVDQQQGLSGQIFKFQIPGGVVGGNIGDGRYPVAFQPLPGEVIVQVGNAAGVRTPAAEFADIMAQRRRADQGDIHRDPRLKGLPGHMHGHMVHADGMGRRIKGHNFPPDAHQLDEIVIFHGFPEAGILLLDPAVNQFFFRGGVNIRQRIKGALLPADGVAQQLQIKGGRLLLAGGHGLVAVLREHLLTDFFI